jgi:hypothetical protein
VWKKAAADCWGPKAAACGDGPMCCLEFVEEEEVSDEDASGGKPIFHATQLPGTSSIFNFKLPHHHHHHGGPIA